MKPSDYLPVVLAVITVIVIAAIDYFQSPARDSGWRFNFAPEAAPNPGAFVRISGNSVYSNKTGYGWLDASGPLESGRWHGDKLLSWEATDNLNLISRRSPDALARSYATGPATFAVDLEPGEYEVWVLSGDSGHLEYVPREPYRIVVEGVTAYDFDMTAQEFYTRYETPVLEDDLDEREVWQRYVEPRFTWSRVVVDVVDGQLNVSVASGRRDPWVMNFMGDYARSEFRQGPETRFTGALNALVVIPAGQNSTHGDHSIARIDALRYRDFMKHWPMQMSAGATQARFTASDHQLGYTVFFPDPLKLAGPYDRMPGGTGTLRLRATPGEYVPILVGICPLQDLGITRIGLAALQPAAGTGGGTVATDNDLAPGVVRYIASFPDSNGQSWRPEPAMIVPADNWNIRDGVTRQFWLTYHVPVMLAPGRYSGEIAVDPEHARMTTIKFELEVLPFRLQRPSHLAVGMTYFSPVQHAYYGEDRFWARMASEFADMRAHNMTSIQYTGIAMDDYSRMDRAMSLYREAGFEQPVYLLESFGVMSRLKRGGIPWDTEAFYSEYLQFIRGFLKEAGSRDWPPAIINFGDEFTNTAMESFGARLAGRLKTIPGIVTGADANGYREVELMAPEVDILAFNNGWDGPQGVNRGRRLLKRETVDLVSKAGATPWLVNVGKDRFSNGYWFWKMARLGIRGKMEWIYRSYNGMPFNGFDGDPGRLQMVFPGPDGMAITSPAYEQMRMGLDDLAYLHTLEQFLEAARNLPAKRVAVARAEAFIRRLDGMIEDDMNIYLDPDSAATSRWPVQRYDEVRTAVIDHILELRGTQAAR